MSRIAAPLVAALLVPTVAACTVDVAHDAPGAAASAHADAVVVGAVDWQSTATLADGTAERAAARATGYLSLPALGKRCTAFLVAPDVVLTNHHCTSTAEHAAGAYVSFGYEDGSNDAATYACDVFLGADATLDVAVLQCPGRPGDARGVLELEDRLAADGEDVYVLHQNCDYKHDPGCAPTKKISRGAVLEVGVEIAHDADTLGGSSGAPMLSSTTHQVIGLHHVGVGADASGRGRYNKAVPSSKLLPWLRARFPSLALGARAVDEPVQVDALEPNDAAAAAASIPVPFGGEASIASATDEDWYAAGGATSATIRFSHAAGDLDLYVLDAAGAVVAQSTGTSDEETVALPSAAAYVRVVGYAGARGAYALEVR